MFATLKEKRASHNTNIFSFKMIIRANITFMMRSVYILMCLNLIWGGNIKTWRASHPARPIPGLGAIAKHSHHWTRHGVGCGAQREETPRFSLVLASDLQPPFSQQGSPGFVIFRSQSPGAQSRSEEVGERMAR